jgi:polysaccharide biosynthesis protein PslH
MSKAEKERLLFIAPIAPSDRGNGLAMRCGFLLDTYARSFAIDLALIPVASSSDQLNDFIGARVRRAQVFRPAGPDSHFGLIERLADPAARLRAFESYGRPSLTSRLTGELRGAIESWCGAERYRIVHVSRLYLASLATRWIAARDRGQRLVLDCDEDDVAAYRRIARMQDRGGNPHAAAWARAEAAGFERLAPHWLPQFDLVLAAAPGEARSLSGRAGNAPVVVIPNTVAAAPARRLNRPRRRVRTVIFVGTMGYAPNADGIWWFATRVWPRLRRQVPFPIRLLIVGANPPARIVRLDARSDMVVTGEVGDVGPFYAAADLAVVPLRAGGGTRIKLLEAAARGVPVVSTRLGAMGTSLRARREMLVADDAAGFARACAALLTDVGAGHAIAARGRARARQDYGVESWAARLTGLVCSRQPMTG